MQLARRLVGALAVLLLALCAVSPAAQAAIAIDYSAGANSYGWCAGYATSSAQNCAQQQCVGNNGTDCRLVLACNSGWSGTAFADGDVIGFGASCGMSDDFWARVVALDECVVASRTICWTDSAFDAHGNARASAGNHQFDLIYYAQVMLQIRNYDPGDADATLGAKTVAAVKKFQADLGRTQTGAIDDELVQRLYDAIGGGPDLAYVMKRDFLDPQQKNIGDSGYSLATPPTGNFSQQLQDRPMADRLTALATVLASAGTRCTLPALDAEPLGDLGVAESWNVDCAEGWYTLLLTRDSRTIITGKSTASAGPDAGVGQKSAAPAGGTGAATTPSGTPAATAPASAPAITTPADNGGNGGTQRDIGTPHPR